MTWHRRRNLIKYYDRAVVEELYPRSLLIYEEITSIFNLLTVYLQTLIESIRFHPQFPDKAVIITPNQLNLHLKILQVCYCCRSDSANPTLELFKAGAFQR